MSTLEVACAADRAYLPHAAAMIDSVLEHGGDGGVRVHFLHGRDISRRDRGLLNGMVAERGGEVSYARLGRRRMRNLAIKQIFPVAHWYRVFLPELLPDVDRVLYLDVDTIALGPLGPLAATDLEGNLLGAAVNVCEPKHRHRAAELLGIAEERDYFNSGVLLMDLAAMRDCGASRAVLTWARDNPLKLGWPDQDALNFVLGEHRLELHPRWNVTNALLGFPYSGEIVGAAALAAARENPGIRHFEGPFENKPWDPGCRHPQREEYLRHRARTPWPLES